jgi:hypothetical protein
VLDEGLDRIIANCLPGTGKGALQGITPPTLGGTGQPIVEVTDRIAEASLGDQPEPSFKGRTEQSFQEHLALPFVIIGRALPWAGLTTIGESRSRRAVLSR